jgi:predicted 2-oxoglutarate/Fe(II)-dependent dioxygenase YbiX
VAGQSVTIIGVILEVMTTSPRTPRQMASSPFRPDPEPVIEQYALGDLVSHDSYGMGHVVQLESSAVMVDFRSQTVRITSPFRKMAKL